MQREWQRLLSLVLRIQPLDDIANTRRIHWVILNGVMHTPAEWLAGS